MAEPDQGTPIVMPKLGLTMSEGLLAQWQVKPGDEVAQGQILFVVETDKISNEIEAPGPGRIMSLLVAEGETAPVGAAVALWTGPTQGSPAATADPTGPELVAASIAGPSTEPTGERLRATPLARRLAASRGVALSKIAGTGPRGRIQGADVDAVLDRVREAPAAPPAVAAAPLAATAQRDLRPLIAARVTRAKAEIPHFYVTADAEFDALADLRKALNADGAAPRKLSVTALLGMAVARALIEHPGANAVWRDARPAPVGRLAVAVAVDTPAGVMAPVVPAGEGVYAFAVALEEAIGRAHAGRLSAADAAPAAIGLSNVGMFGVRALTPIIDPDQAFMLGVGAPHVAFRLGPDGSPKAVQEVTLTLACDHRLIDGAAASRLLATIIAAIEHPLRLVVRL